MTEAQANEGEASRVGRLLREAIIGGDRAPGSRLVEREIAAALGVSRVPVREALHALVAEGLAVARPNRWMTVRQFSERDIEELFQVRSACDSLAFSLAARAVDEQDLARLELVLATELSAIDSGDTTALHTASADFHELVIELSGNTLLGEIWHTLSGRMRWLLGQHDHLAEMHDEHAQLYEAIAAGDPDSASALALAHLETSRRALEAHRATER